MLTVLARSVDRAYTEVVKGRKWVRWAVGTCSLVAIWICYLIWPRHYADSFEFLTRFHPIVLRPVTVGHIELDAMTFPMESAPQVQEALQHEMPLRGWSQTGK